MPTHSFLQEHVISVAVAAILAVVLLPHTAYAQDDLSTAIRQAADGVTPADYPNLHALASCVVEKEAALFVEESFRSKTSVGLREFTSILYPRGGGTRTPEGRWVSAQEYREYGLRDAIRLGVTPYTNPDVLETVATAYAVPGHALFAKADESERSALLHSLLGGSIAAATYSDGSYVPLSPNDNAWADVVDAVRTGDWDPAMQWVWKAGRLVGTSEQNPAGQPLLRFIVQDERSEGRTPVIDWEADEDLHDVLLAEYASAFYESLLEVAQAENCPIGE